MAQQTSCPGLACHAIVDVATALSIDLDLPSAIDCVQCNSNTNIIIDKDGNEFSAALFCTVCTLFLVTT